MVTNFVLSVSMHYMLRYLIWTNLTLVRWTFGGIGILDRLVCCWREPPQDGLACLLWHRHYPSVDSVLLPDAHAEPQIVSVLERNGNE